MPDSELKEFIKVFVEIKNDLQDIKKRLDEQDSKFDNKIEALKNEIPNIVEQQVEKWLAKKFFAPYVLLPLLIGMSVSLIGIYHLSLYAARILQQLFQFWK